MKKVSAAEETQPSSGGRRYVVAVVLLVVAAAAWLMLWSGNLPWMEDEYQAVFLTNGQVYFGKIYSEGGDYANLRDVYYLQVTEPAQSGQLPAGNINLVKLGDELHGPKDGMRISRASILFIEDLKADSRVVQAISQLKNK